MNHIEAIKQVLTRLEGMNHEDSIFAGEFDKEIKLLSQAIAEAEKQEPFAWMSNESAYRLKHGGNSKGAVPVHAKKSTASKIPLYTRPQTTQEPAAWGMEHPDGDIIDVITPEEHAREEGGYTVALYREPQPKQEPPTQPKREWVGLTDEQVEKIIKANMSLQINFAGIRQDFEAAHGIKENT